MKLSFYISDDDDDDDDQFNELKYFNLGLVTEKSDSLSYYYLLSKSEQFNCKMKYLARR